MDTPKDYSIELRSNILGCIERFEKSLSAIPDRPYLDEETEEVVHPIPELVADERTDLRLSFYSELTSLFSSLTDPDHTPVSVYEKSVYLLLVDRMRRSFGYYQALSRAEAEVARRNSDIGDARALDVSVSDITNYLGKLDDIDFVRKLCGVLSIHEDDTENIVSNLISKEFSRK